VVLNLFCLIYPLTKSKKLILPLTMFSVSRHDFSDKGAGQGLLEICCELTLKYMNFCACTKLVNLWDETLIKCSYKQAWVLSRRGSLRLLKSWKQFHMNRHITESREKRFGRKNIQLYWTFFFWKRTISTSQSLSKTFVLAFHVQYMVKIHFFKFLLLFFFWLHPSIV